MPNVDERVVIYIRENMDVSKHSWLVATLEHYKGIISAYFEHGDHHRLAVLFERRHFSYITLIDTIKEHGYHGKIMHHK